MSLFIKGRNKSEKIRQLGSFYAYGRMYADPVMSTDIYTNNVLLM